MSGPPPNTGEVFDVRKVRKLVELMQEFDLGLLDLQQGDQRIKLRRGSMQQIVMGGALPAPAAPFIATSAASTGPGAVAAKPAAATDDAKLSVIKSPMVGTFYPASAPEAPPFVKVGDRVGPETTVCIVEAMKVFNEIPAECSGTIAAVLVNRGDPVEFGQPLFRVDTSR